MKEHFFAFIKPTEDQYKEIWSSCIFTFDANILLNFYRYKNDTTNTFFDLLEKLKERIYLTNQASLEYFKNRLDVISEQEKAYSEVKDSILKHIEEPLQHQRKHPHINIELLDEFKLVSNKIKSELEDRSKEYSQRLSNDEILKKVINLFDKKVGIQYAEELLNEIYLEGDKRYNENIPPGFKDKNKGGIRQFGDLILWFQIIDLAKEIDKNIVFVTDDEKEDWLYIHKGRTISLLPELQNEFQQKTSKKIYIYNAQQFYEYASKLLNSNVDEETIEEVRTLREENKITSSESFQNETIILQDEDIDNHILKGIRTVENDQGWAELAPLGLYLIRHTPINYRNYGYYSLRRFIESRKRFETKFIQRSPNAKNVDSGFVRLKTEDQIL